MTNFHFLKNMSLYIGNKFLSPWDASKHTLERSVKQLHACSLSLDIGGHNQPCCDRQDVRECMQMNMEGTFCENEFYLRESKKSFSYQQLPRSSCFKTEAWSNFEIVYPCFPNFWKFSFFHKNHRRSWSPPNLLINCFSLIRFHWIFQLFANFDVFAAACQRTLISYTRNMYLAITLGKLNLMALKNPVGQG